MYAEDDLLPVSALQHLLFCPRQCALIHVERLWAENALTIQGRHLHEKADRGRGETRRGEAGRGGGGGDGGGPGKSGGRGGRRGGPVRIARGLMLRSLALGLYGKADVVEFRPAGDPDGGVGGSSEVAAVGVGRRAKRGSADSRLRRTKPLPAEAAAAGGSAEPVAATPVAAGLPAADAPSAEQWLGGLDLLAVAASPSGGGGPASGDAPPPPPRTEPLLVRAAPLSSSSSSSPLCGTNPLIPPADGRGAGTTTVPFPVEYKRGKPKANRCDEVQLCAQALCLEEMLGTPVPAGAIFYGVTRRRVDVPIDAALRELTLRLIADLRTMVDESRTPAAVWEKKCRRCSLLKLCLPEAHPGTDAAGRYLRRAVGQSLAAADGPAGE